MSAASLTDVSRLVRAVLASTATTMALTACSPTPRMLENAVVGMPGVIRVEAAEASGDDGIPFQRIPKRIDVLMSADSSEAEVLAVYDALEDAIASGDVQSVELRLYDPRVVTLSTGEGIRATEAMAEDLVAAVRDDAVLRYRREAHPVLPGVSITLAPTGFENVVRRADLYRDRPEIELVEVSSGDFSLTRDTVNEDLARTDARQRFVQQVARRFRLTGADVGGRGPLDLFADPADLAALRRFVEGPHTPRAIEPVVVRSSP